MCKVSAAFVILSSLATARKYCNTRISKNTSYFEFTYIITHISIPFKYGKQFNICICYFLVVLYTISKEA